MQSLRRWFMVALCFTLSLGTAVLAEPVVEVEPVIPPLEHYAEALAEVMEFLINTFDGALDEHRLLDGALRGMMDALGDPHSVYLDAQEVQDFLATVQGRFGGIGASLEVVDELPMIVSVFSVTPASMAGLAPGDFIIEVDGESTQGVLLSTTVARIRGEPGTEVELVIYRHRTEQTFRMTLLRALIEVPSLEYRELDEHLAYVRIQRFGEHTAGDMEVVAAFIQTKRVGGVIIDVRGNPGGYLSSTLQVAEMLTPPGPLLRINRRGDEQVLYGEGEGWGIPLVVLVDSTTTSGAEILAAALQDRGTGVIIGHESTFGKGSVQDIIWLTNGGALKLTTAHFFSPLGHPIHQVGVSPDIRVERPDTPEPLSLEECGPGSPRPVVAAAQRALNELGFAPGVVDGLYGPRTTRAVVTFQAAAGVEPSGRVDSATRRALEAQLRDARDVLLQRGIEYLRASLGR